MRNTVLLILLIFLVWGAGSVYWYVCKIKGLCDDDSSSLVAAKPPVTGNLTFTFQGTTPDTNDQTAATIDSLKALDLDTLLINGFYFQGESPSTGNSRAASIQSLLTAANFKKPISIKSSLRDTQVEGHFTAHQFEAIKNASDQTAETSEGNESDFTVVKTADKITIFFPLASADPHTNQSLINDLKEFARQVIASKEPMQVVGHTDNSGTPEVNISYGQQRADAITAILVEYGVPVSQISAKSKGETEPIASNDSEAGRRKNRRVEVITIKN